MLWIAIELSNLGRRNLTALSLSHVSGSDSVSTHSLKFTALKFDAVARSDNTEPGSARSPHTISCT